MDNVLEIRKLSKNLGGFRLREVSFTLPRGYVMGFIGPNGAGKTTTIKLTMNLMRRDDGEVRVFGLDNRRYGKEIKQRIGFVYDDSHYYEELSILDNRRIVAGLYQGWDEKAFQQRLQEFDLPPDQKLKNLSRGMRTKFGLAIALSHGAELLIMDEPTSGLDPVFRSELLDILQQLMVEENKSVLFSTHITTDLERVADFICFINQGHIVFCRSKDEVLQDHVLVKGALELLCPEANRLFIGLRKNRYGFEGLSADPRGVRRIFGDRVLVEQPGLDDIMVYNVRGHQHG
ncbi:MAG: ABC transporter ATP-binding protein [Heliobacteriaceae bacterium]|nr:ABC transporter ATP-binding protein [Heliobacteriaceae bacterium]